MKVFWDPNCLLHDPPYEILSGYKVPYFESPSRLQVIKKELEEYPSLFQIELTDSSSGSIDILSHIEMVHGRGYLSYLRNAYEEWVRDGGSAVPLVDDGFLRFSTHASIRMRCYRERSHIRSCYLDLVKAKSMRCALLPKQVS
jgi:acetoin utilization deacetylase AcuC-like enzyme